MMSYADYEKSYENSMPIELYEISYSGRTWYFTNSIDEVIVKGNKYQPLPIERGEREENSDAEKASLEIKISRNSPITDIFKITPPSEPVTLNIFQYHATMPQIETVVIWKGRIINVAWEGEEMTLTSESVFSSLLRVGVTRKFSRSCTHALYGEDCGVNRADFRATGKVMKQVGVVLQVATGKPLNWFAGGFIVYTNRQSGAVERRAVTASTENTITLASYPLGVEEGRTDITAYAGCNHTHSHCKDKFKNILNYGGQPYIPTKNPFGGSTIF